MNMKNYNSYSVVDDVDWTYWIGSLPCFSISGIVNSETFDADFNELYKMQTIQMIKPTRLVLSNVILLFGSGGKKLVWHFSSGLFDKADQVK